MKKSENARRSWRGISASRSTNFQTFLSVQFFFIVIRLRICGGGSAPHFAANAVLKTKLSRRAVPKIKVDPSYQDILRFRISENAQRSSGAKLYSGLFYYIFLILKQTA